MKIFFHKNKIPTRFAEWGSNKQSLYLSSYVGIIRFRFKGFGVFFTISAFYSTPDSIKLYF